MRRSRTGERVWTWLQVAAAMAAVAVLAPASSWAQQVVVNAGQAVESPGAGQTFEVECSVLFSEGALKFGTNMGYDTVELPDGAFLHELGWPMLPTRTLMVAVPDGMRVTGVRLVGSEQTDLAGEYTVYPTQQPRLIGRAELAKENAFIEPDAQLYASSTPYPAEIVEFAGQTDLAGQAMAAVRFCPVQYIPSEKKLRLHTSIQVVLEGVSGYVCGDYLPTRISKTGREDYETRVRQMVVNPDDVTLRAEPAGTPHTMGVAAGTYDYVIIVPVGWDDNFQSLADWKTQKGRPATIVTTDWIYNSGGYSGSNAEKIQDFVQDAHSTWGATAFLLGGDTNNVPYHSKYIDGEYVENDTFYADYDGDWTCEVNVGRASVANSTQLGQFKNKVFTYEQDPPLTDYAKTAFFCGFDLSGCGTHEGENCKKDIDSLYLPGDWTFRREYDTESGTHMSDVIAYLNQGNNFANHQDHCNSTTMCAGDLCHGECMVCTDYSNLTNGDRQTIMYSTGCYACDYSYGTCIAECFVRATNGGGIAFIGNSHNGYFYSGYDDYLSSRYDRYFFRSFFDQGVFRLGPCFSDHKNDAYWSDPGTSMRYLFTGLTLLGDPELPILSEDPESLTVTHDSEINVGESNTFVVQVYSGGSPVNSATVCLWKGDEIYEVDQTNASGLVTFYVNPATTGTMLVTSWKYNYVPDLSSAEAVSTSTYTLTTYTSGSGDIDLDPPGGTYTSGTWVECTADPDTGWHFDHWEDDLTGSTNPDDIQMTSNKTVTAVFAQDQYTLTVNVSGSGSVVKNPNQSTYTYGQNVQLTAYGDTGWHFDHWENDLTGSTNPDYVYMNGNKTVTAVFVQDQYTLTINITGSGSVVKNPDQSTYTYGQNVQLTAYGDTGWDFDHWEDDLTGSTNPDYVYMNGNKTVTAVFVENTYTLTVYTTGQGSVTLDPPGGTYAPGTWVDLDAESDSGWCFDQWTGDVTGTVNPESIQMNADYSVTAVFAQPCTVGLGDMNCDGVVNNFDIDAFVLALTSAEHIPAFDDYYAVYPDCDGMRADCDGSGAVNNFDIDAFVGLL